MYDVSYRLNSPNCIAEAVEDDLIVINLFSGKYYNMRGTAALAWESLINGSTPRQLLSANDWSNSQTQAFDQFLQLLVGENLIVEQTQAVSPESLMVILISDESSPFQVDVFTDMEEMLRLDPIHEADSNIGWPHKP
jgi:hypothetical protein